MIGIGVTLKDEEYHDVLIQAIALLKSRASATCCVVEGHRKRNYG